MRRKVLLPATDQLCEAMVDHIVTYSALFDEASQLTQPVDASTLHEMLVTIGNIAINNESPEVSITATDRVSGINPSDWFNLNIYRLMPPEDAGEYGKQIGEISLWASSKEHYRQPLDADFRYNAWYRLFMRGDTLVGFKDETAIGKKKRYKFSRDSSKPNNFSNNDGRSLINLIHLFADIS